MALQLWLALVGLCVNYVDAETVTSCQELGIDHKSLAGHSGWRCGTSHVPVCDEPERHAGGTWADVHAKCSTLGARLCTLNELQSGCASGTGGGYDKSHVWSSTSCGDGSYWTFRWVIQGQEMETRDSGAVCEPSDQADIYTRCCADPAPACAAGDPDEDTPCSVKGCNSLDWLEGTQAIYGKVDRDARFRYTCGGDGWAQGKRSWKKRPDTKTDVCGGTNFPDCTDTCHESKTAAEAEVLCAHAKMRLCSATELAAGIVSDATDEAHGGACAGGGLDAQDVWSSTPCGPSGGHREVVRYEDAVAGAAPRCVEADSGAATAAVRCCVDYHTRAPTTSPTASPTKRPTTPMPTETQAPTPGPSKRPTGPSYAPTRLPTASPTDRVVAVSVMLGGFPATAGVVAEFTSFVARETGVGVGDLEVTWRHPHIHADDDDGPGCSPCTSACATGCDHVDDHDPDGRRLRRLSATGVLVTFVVDLNKVPDPQPFDTLAEGRTWLADTVEAAKQKYRAASKAPTKSPTSRLCVDNLFNGFESAVDCGGPHCPKCDDGRTCNVGSDCRSGICKEVGEDGRCDSAAPSASPSLQPTPRPTHVPSTRPTAATASPTAPTAVPLLGAANTGGGGGGAKKKKDGGKSSSSVLAGVLVSIGTIAFAGIVWLQLMHRRHAHDAAEKDPHADGVSQVNPMYEGKGGGSWFFGVEARPQRGSMPARVSYKDRFVHGLEHAAHAAEHAVEHAAHDVAHAAHAAGHAASHALHATEHALVAGVHAVEHAVGWEQHHDEASGKTYYHHRGRQETVWEKPDGFKAQDGSVVEDRRSSLRDAFRLGDGSAAAGKHGHDAVEDHLERAFDGAGDGARKHHHRGSHGHHRLRHAARSFEHAVEHAAHAVGHAAAAAAHAVTPHHHHRHHGHGNRRGTTSTQDWLHGHKCAADGNAPGAGWERHIDERGRTFYHNSTTGETSWDKPAGKGGWVEHVDHKGRTYYHSPERKETTWTKPEGYEAAEVKKKKSGGFMMHTSDSSKKKKTAAAAEQKLKQAAEAVAAAQPERKMRRSESLLDTFRLADSPSPTPQQEQGSPTQQQQAKANRYLDAAAARVQATKAADVARTRALLAARSARKSASPPKSDWEKHHDESTSSPYWSHRKRGATTWFDPHAWEKHTNDDGDTYYHHPEKGTQWEKPEHMANT